jgi:hypothetical protein
MSHPPTRRCEERTASLTIQKRRQEVYLLHRKTKWYKISRANPVLSIVA